MSIEERKYTLHQYGEKPGADQAAGGVANWLRENYSPIIPGPPSIIKDASGSYSLGRPPVAAKEAGGTPSRIKIGHMGLFGDVTVPEPGKWAGRAGIFVLAAIVGAISLAALLMKVPMIEKGTKAAIAATPVGAGLNAAKSK